MKPAPLPRRRKLLIAGFAAVLLLTLWPAETAAQVVLTASRPVRVRAKPSLSAKRTDGLTPGKTVTLLSGRRGSFFKVRLENNKTGWIHGKYLLLPDIEEREFGTETVAAPAKASAFPMCGPARHYRWSAKISTAGSNQTPTKPSVHAALQWAPLPFSGHTLVSWCQDRMGRENRPFSVLGWVRRVRKEDDGDVHVEITQNANDPVEDCFVVEIPAANLNTRFDQARNDLAALLSVDRLTDKDFATPTRVRFTGMAFWDGWHATATGASRHGRCNSSRSAAWELHPVFKVAAP